MASQKTIDVEVAYASSNHQKLVSVTLDAESSAYDAIKASKILETFPALI